MCHLLEWKFHQWKQVPHWPWHRPWKPRTYIQEYDLHGPVSPLRVSAQEKFTQDSVSRSNNSRTWQVKGFRPRFILMVAGQALGSLLPRGKSAWSKGLCTACSPQPWTELGRALHTVSNNSLSTNVRACARAHPTCAMGKRTRGKWAPWPGNLHFPYNVWPCKVMLLDVLLCSPEEMKIQSILSASTGAACCLRV